LPKQTVRELAIAGKKVLIRVDFNVPQKEDGSVSDDRRIRAALPTIQHCLSAGASVVLLSHLGRPKGDPAKDAKFKMNPVAARLAELLPGVSVTKADDVAGPDSVAKAGALKAGQVLLVENVRFDPGEQKGDGNLAKRFRALADCYVNDAFGTCHREDVSMYATPAEFPAGSRAVGFLVEKELRILNELLSAPKKPMIGVMGGAKVSDKINFIEAILKRVDKLLIGGAMAYTFKLALGGKVGNSLVEKDKLDLARKILELAGDRLVLPVDTVVADKFGPDSNTKTVEGDIPDGWEGFDIGPETIASYKALLAGAATILWNGPMGLFEDPRFQAGTRAIAEAMVASSAVTVVGGGESAEAVEEFGYAPKLTHVSTGGGAFLEYVEGKPFRTLEVIDNA
jgi:phosphoglycerate kinase